MKFRERAQHAFSMIEIVVALGVISFAIIAILGIFPIALSSNRSGMNEARAAQLVRAITGTIDSQCATFTSVDCFGQSLNLASLAKTDGPKTLYASYSSPSQPAISTSATGSIYSIELRFDNNPPVTTAGLGSGKVNLIQIRIYGKNQSEGSMEFFYLARNKG
jgi:uncharacterized protein (TIGR02598 family)